MLSRVLRPASVRRLVTTAAPTQSPASTSTKAFSLFHPTEEHVALRSMLRQFVEEQVLGPPSRGQLWLLCQILWPLALVGRRCFPYAYISYYRN